MRRVRPAVVVLDLLMPDLDGFDVVERLRADPLVDDVPIVVLTAKDMTRADQSGSRARSATSPRRERCPEPSSSTSSAGLVGGKDEP